MLDFFLDWLLFDAYGTPRIRWLRRLLGFD